jgi:hypothetical protein
MARSSVESGRTIVFFAVFAFSTMIDIRSAGIIGKSLSLSIWNITELGKNHYKIENPTCESRTLSQDFLLPPALKI